MMSGRDLLTAEMFVRTAMKKEAGGVVSGLIEAGSGAAKAGKGLAGAINVATKTLGEGAASVLKHAPGGKVLAPAANLAIRAAPYAAAAYGASEADKATGSNVRNFVRKQMYLHKLRQAQRRAAWDQQRGMMI